jgi:hypothetical protein
MSRILSLTLYPGLNILDGSHFRKTVGVLYLLSQHVLEPSLGNRTAAPS